MLVCHTLQLQHEAIDAIARGARSGPLSRDRLRKRDGIDGIDDRAGLFSHCNRKCAVRFKSGCRYVRLSFRDEQIKLALARPTGQRHMPRIAFPGRGSDNIGRAGDRRKPHAEIRLEERQVFLNAIVFDVQQTSEQARVSGGLEILFAK